MSNKIIELSLPALHPAQAKTDVFDTRFPGPLHRVRLRPVHKQFYRDLGRFPPLVLRCSSGVCKDRALTRTLRNRRIAWRCWAAILASAFPLFVYLPLIARIRSLTLAAASAPAYYRSEEHTSELQSPCNL